MSDSAHPLQSFVQKLETHSPLSSEDRQAVLALPYALRKVEAYRILVRQGSRATTCSFVVSGYAYRDKCTSQGARQILAIHLRGDALDLENMLLRHADHNVYALTQAVVAVVSVDNILALVGLRLDIAAALWRDTLTDASINREWALNIGRRKAYNRVAHLLCEIAHRQRYAGIASGNQFELPMTQQHLADCVGLTPVHVNRVIQQLRRGGVIAQRKHHLIIDDWERLMAIADFSPSYLSVTNTRL